MPDTYSAVPVERSVYDEVPVSINELNRQYLVEGSASIEDRPYCRALYNFQ
jgi:hypothetical protein